MNPETLILQGELREIERASQFASQFCRERAIHRDHERILDLILEELITNTVKHGSPPAGSPISVSLDRVPGGIEILYKDQGTPFDPNHDVPEPDLNITLTRRSAGGLGWPLIKFYCRRLDYRREGATNVLDLIVRLDDPGTETLPS